ncbi:MAG: 2,3-bisphosphoglycerate-dependent phosphoglycerate mutase [uncultured bacterium]|uniref:phosphoglycerate mutase (2,3-diphosphoglycerate-dependent) n=1 Tax=Berkelbacteria bacterium GW2011_GWA2_38_9 TaxID=1618334 RepID=A0A0G0LH13_9BACT|nr:MAG: 2,3-bisphosphoglycerate-dependent phosphoglycerate mutase [uncultured bacterium]KKQ90367.1 MAG: 2,3-bisphosphoglycerate-dependent phosphoglycerate mutase [Berkelbacteria bacterium GW2011_GWA2_38_9]
MGKLYLVRHGKTQYNLDHRFCGLTDVPLVVDGIKNAETIAKLLHDVKFTAVYSSNLERAYETAKIILTETNQTHVKVNKDPRLNERDYGVLTGKYHQEAEDFLGKEQVQLWRRGWDTCPPEGESLKDVYNRAVPMFKDEIFPQLVKPESAVLICAHGNSLRALITYLDQPSLAELAKLEIVYDQAYIYEFDENGLHQSLDEIPRQSRWLAK